MADLAGILNVIALDDRLLTAGQPTAGELAAVAAAGYEAVIRLSMPDAEPGLVGEDEIVTALGMDYLHIPVVWTAPAWENLESFLAVMNAWQGRRLLVHCARNFRVSVFVGLHFVARGRWSREQARDHVLGVFEPDAVWNGFLEEGLRRLGS